MEINQFKDSLRGAHRQVGFWLTTASGTVAAIRYPRRGNRGVSMSQRANRFGPAFAQGMSFVAVGTDVSVLREATDQLLLETLMDVP